MSEPEGSAKSSSQPQGKAATSGAAEPSTKDASGGTAVETPSPYGTRSRNRTGNSRPNYAEDKDNDLDFECAPPKKAGDSKKSTRQSNASATTTNAEKNQNGAHKKSLPVDEAKNATSQNGSKDNAPAPTAPAASAAGVTSAAPTASQSSKKRKAGAQSGNGSNGASGEPQQVVSQSSTATVLAKRLGGQGTMFSNGYAETNMLSFENCKSKPNKDGKLVSDSGTILAPNGEFVYGPSPVPLQKKLPCLVVDDVLCAASWEQAGVGTSMWVQLGICVSARVCVCGH